MTTDKTSGSHLSQNEMLAKFEEIINEYENKIGLNRIKKSEEIDLILELTASDMSRMTALQCGEAAFILFQYSAYIQKEVNRHNVRKYWGEKQLEILLGKYGDQYGDGYTKYEIRLAKLVIGDDAARLINKIIIHASARVMELHDMSNRINMMGRALLEYQGAKSRGGI